MKQRFYLFLLLLSATVRISAQTVIGDFTYTFSGSEATIVGCTASGDIVFPETVVYGGNTYNVTAIHFPYTGLVPIQNAPTSMTGKSIKSIECDNVGIGTPTSASICISWKHCASFDFPHLVSLKRCGILGGTTDGAGSDVITSVSLPELETVEGCDALFRGCTKLSSISLPKLKKLDTYEFCASLPLLTSLSLPELTEVSDRSESVMYNLPALTTLNLPKLQTMGGHYSFMKWGSLQTLNLPELISIKGYSLLTEIPNLHTLNVPKLHHIEGIAIITQLAVSNLALADGCEMVNTDCFYGNNATDLTVTGLTKIIDGYYNFATTPSGPYILKHISLPDITYIEDRFIGVQLSELESFSAPKLKKLENTNFLEEMTTNCTTVDIHSLEEVVNSRMFAASPVTSLTLRGDLKADANSAMTLNAYPTVITIDDQSTVHDIPATFFEHIKGGRFIAPRGKAALYATKWNLPLNHTMIYAPVKYEKHTDTSKYASGSIAPADGAFVYGGITYTNQYDFHQAMLPGECLASNVLGPNDLGFTPSLPSLTVSDRTDYMSPFKTYYASAYANTPNRKEGVLTLTPLANTPHSTVQGFGAAAADLYEGVGTAAGGFLCNGNNDGFSALYMPYVPDAVPTPATNYLIAGDDGTQTSRTGGLFKFYWHPGDAAYPMGFYECAATTIPETRAYLSLPMSLSPRAKEIRLVFEDDQPTGISDIEVPTDTIAETGDAAWYTLLGIRLTAKPTAPGVYLHGNHKVIIR